LPIAEANNLIRTALLNVPFTQDVQVAGIGTTTMSVVWWWKMPFSSSMSFHTSRVVALPELSSGA
jgi:hypothetical protein